MQELVIFAVEELIKQAPALIVEFQKLFSTSAPTPEDFAALRAKVRSKTYRDYVPASKLTDDLG